MPEGVSVMRNKVKYIRQWKFVSDFNKMLVKSGSETDATRLTEPASNNNFTNVVLSSFTFYHSLCIILILHGLPQQ